MSALVVYESMFGNTEQIARAVARALEAAGPVELAEVGVAPAVIDSAVTLLVVGGPTHAFSMSRVQTRADAVKQADAPVVSAGRGIREWLGEVGLPAGLATAAFDTKVAKPRMPGSAAAAAAKLLRSRGRKPVDKPATFYVNGSKGPLVDGEVERAFEWGVKLVALASGATPQTA